MSEWQRAADGALVGDVVAGKYELLRQVGRGGMGTVFEARHATLGRSVAIKVLRPDVADDRDVIERFLREARSVGALAHPRIVDVFDVGWTDDGVVPWFAMELLEGKNLAAELTQSKELGAVRAISIMIQVLDALEVAHARGIVHRDLKPENIFLVRHGIDDDVKVLDFGISKVLDKRMTVTGVILGTPAYMSPEQARGARDVDHRVDIYAAGAILFEMLGGRPPFGGAGASYHQILLAIMTGERPRLAELRPNLHPALAALTERALAATPADRWQSVVEMRDALVEIGDVIDQLLDGSPESSLNSLVTRAWAPPEEPPGPADSRRREATPAPEPVTPARTTPPARTPTPARAPPPEPEPPPRPLLEGVRPARPARPAPKRARSSVRLPLLVLGGLVLAALVAWGLVVLLAPG
jgi:serine/threonine-protein kinase